MTWNYICQFCEYRCEELPVETICPECGFDGFIDRDQWNENERLNEAEAWNERKRDADGL